jgi:poly-gamma-glutamate capsule biosynthesis protein CapA/YwtB (metallophosphatase superfamily)
MMLPYTYAYRVVLRVKVVSLLRYTNVGLQKNSPHKKEKLTTYYSIKTSNTRGWKLAGAQFPKAPNNFAGLLEIEVYFSYLDRIGLLKILFV